MLYSVHCTEHYTEWFFMLFYEISKIIPNDATSLLCASVAKHVCSMLKLKNILIFLRFSYHFIYWWYCIMSLVMYRHQNVWFTWIKNVSDIVWSIKHVAILMSVTRYKLKKHILSTFSRRIFHFCYGLKKNTSYFDAVLFSFLVIFIECQT